MNDNHKLDIDVHFIMCYQFTIQKNVASAEIQHEIEIS